MAKTAIVCNYVLGYHYNYSAFSNTGVNVIVKMFHSI